ncbi:uncharacterized protein G2W53_035482 [Senna tora]|uniref:Uncharacterized protein n=1 Tax=Senna tora TaxID=362788 RepID=A0A834T3M2_9FABA|nr:uncharacterized protein G2W53_035482 [Senna tora]
MPDSDRRKRERGIARAVEEWGIDGFKLWASWEDSEKKSIFLLIDEEGNPKALSF